MGKCCVIYINCLKVAITALQRGCGNPYILMKRSLHTNNQITLRKGWPHHRVYVPQLLSNGGESSFASQRHQISESAQCETGPTVFLFYPRRLSRKSKRLQLPLQRQHFLLSYFKTLKVCPAGAGRLSNVGNFL